MTHILCLSFSFSFMAFRFDKISILFTFPYILCFGENCIVYFTLKKVQSRCYQVKCEPEIWEWPKMGYCGHSPIPVSSVSIVGISSSFRDNYAYLFCSLTE